MGFKDRLKNARINKNLKQIELSEKIGMSKNAVHNYETGTSYPNIETLYKIFEVLEIDPNYLFWDELSENVKKKIVEQNNLRNFENLNQAGQSKVNEYINDLIANEKYTKEDKKDIIDFNDKVRTVDSDDELKAVAYGNGDISDDAPVKHT